METPSRKANAAPKVLTIKKAVWHKNIVRIICVWNRVCTIQLKLIERRKIWLGWRVTEISKLRALASMKN